MPVPFNKCVRNPPNSKDKQPYMQMSNKNQNPPKFTNMPRSYSYLHPKKYICMLVTF